MSIRRGNKSKKMLSRVAEDLNHWKDKDIKRKRQIDYENRRENENPRPKTKHKADLEEKMKKAFKNK